MKQTIAYYLTLLGKNFNHYCSVRLQEMRLSPGLLYFVLYIGNHPGCSPKELCTALHMDGGHAARSLVKLEQGGFIRQEQNPRDRRAHILELTAEGADVFRASHDLFHRWEQEVLGEMESVDKQRLLSLLEQAAQTITEAKEEQR